MRILLLSNMFAPEAFASAPLNTDCCRYLAEAGHEVTAVTAFPHYPEWRVWPEYRGKLYRKEQMDGVEVRRVWSYVPRRPGTIGRVLHYAVFALVALPACLRLRKQDVIICVTPPIELAMTAWFLQKMWRAPVVLWVKDLVPEVAIQLGMMKNPLAIKLARMLERFSYKRADRLAVLCDGFKDYLLRQGVPADKISVSPDWVNTALYHADVDSAGFRVEHDIPADHFLVMHAGNVGAKQALETVVQAAALLKEHEDITFRIVGDGSAKAELIKEAERLKLPNLKFLPVQPKEKLPAMLASANTLLIHQSRSVVESVIPSKLLSYMASGRCIVAGVNENSETAKAIARASGGVTHPPEEPEALAAAILKVYRDRELADHLGRSGRRFVEEYFSRSAVLSKLEALLKSETAKSQPIAERVENLT